MTRLHASIHLVLVAALACGGAGLVPSSARADDPDVRNVRPAVMLLVDTSGSMEYALQARSGTVAGRVADCSRGERDRWISLLEVLTGPIQNYSCASLDRRVVFPGAPDQFYPLHFARPRSNGQFYGVPGFVQSAGILDTYLERVKFGLMVFDNIYGIQTGTDEDLTMMPSAAFAPRIADSTGPLGDYSYGPNRTLTFPGCTTTYTVNGGARREGVPASAGGALVSYGVDDPSDPNLFRTINGVIQDRLLTTRPYGGTPTGALLQDYEYYLDHHPDAAPPTAAGAADRLAACRPQYAILISDGQPSDPFRSVMHCDAVGPGGARYQCPYDRPVDIASRLCAVGADGRCTASRFRGLFAVLFQPGTASDADVVQATAAMNDIAAAGGTCAAPGACAYLATDTASLTAAIAAALDRASPGTRTRTTPAFGSVAISGGTGLGQFEVTSGFRVGDSTRPWSGVINRQRWECDGTTPVARTLETRDRFAETLDAQATRTIRTVVTGAPSALSGIVVGPTAASFPIPSAPTGSIPRTTVAAMSDFSRLNLAINAATLNVPTAAARVATIAWVRADPDTDPARVAHKMGDVYHSQPVIVGPPSGDIADESYNLFMRRPEVSGRPPMIYYGTNDGIIHATVLANHTSPIDGTTLSEGQELWGFIPPALLPKLATARTSHQFLADGAPVVRDVFFQRHAGDVPSSAQYHTVLLMGLRQGGSQYVALDVTDPRNPVFLWQWTHEDMGMTYGRPGLTQALVDLGSGPEERAVAILPGGMGQRAPGDCPLDAANRAPRSVGQTRDARLRVSCWSGTAGRSFHVVDVASGVAIRSWTAADIQVPFTGAVSLFTGQTGSISTRAYVTNADGILWRLDMSSSNPADWTFRPLHDLYWNDGPLAGHGSVEPPVVSIDIERRPVVILGTGDPENFETPGRNLVVSLLERTTATPYVASAEINWEIPLREQEMVTGPLELFDGRVYFGTFASGTTPADACNFGSSRLWGVDFLATGTTPAGYPAPASSRSPAFGWESAADAGRSIFSTHYTDLGANQIVMGVGVTQRPTCVQGSTVADPYIGPRFDVDQIGGGQFELVAQVSSDSVTSASAPAEVATIRRTLPAPISYTRTLGTASVDF